ncbi:MAG: hypothetical protein OXG40_11795, partial [Acidimicrobiaceae bacterium]|nr:hypothetical protein [Acidimicrobiaceae bacterium]
MSTNPARALAAILLTFGLLAAGCGDGSEPEATAPQAAETQAEAPEPEVALPGEGVSVTMGRGNWP